MAQLKNVVDPFGEVNVYPGTLGGVRVVATILMQPHKEGAQTGIALDGSGSMRKMYGLDDGSRVRSAPWGFYVFMTDGELHDLDDVVAYSKKLAQDVAAGRRNPLKFVLIGLGPDINEYQMTELDDLETGTDVDLWDHKLASEMRML